MEESSNKLNFGTYIDVNFFCCNSTIEKIAATDVVLTDANQNHGYGTFV